MKESLTDRFRQRALRCRHGSQCRHGGRCDQQIACEHTGELGAGSDFPCADGVKWTEQCLECGATRERCSCHQCRMQDTHVRPWRPWDGTTIIAPRTEPVGSLMPGGTRGPRM